MVQIQQLPPAVRIMETIPKMPRVAFYESSDKMRQLIIVHCTKDLSPHLYQYIETVFKEEGFENGLRHLIRGRIKESLPPIIEEGQTWAHEYQLPFSYEKDGKTYWIPERSVGPYLLPDDWMSKYESKIDGHLKETEYGRAYLEWRGEKNKAEFLELVPGATILQ